MESICGAPEQRSCSMNRTTSGTLSTYRSSSSRPAFRLKHGSPFLLNANQLLLGAADVRLHQLRVDERPQPKAELVRPDFARGVLAALRQCPQGAEALALREGLRRGTGGAPGHVVPMPRGGQDSPTGAAKGRVRPGL